MRKSLRTVSKDISRHIKNTTTAFDFNPLPSALVLLIESIIIRIAPGANDDIAVFIRSQKSIVSDVASASPLPDNIAPITREIQSESIPEKTANAL